jgi:transcriptional regulator with XRE-family HTH domain
MTNKKITMRDLIREIRHSVNLTQQQFSKKIGVAGSAISHYETGVRLPTLYIVKKIVYFANKYAGYKLNYNDMTKYK